MTKTVVTFDEIFVLVMMEVAVEVVNEDFILNAVLLNYEFVFSRSAPRMEKVKRHVSLFFTLHTVYLYIKELTSYIVQG